MHLDFVLSALYFVIGPKSPDSKHKAPSSISSPNLQIVVREGISLPHDLTRILVVTNTEKSRVTEFVVFRPLDETDLYNYLRLNPVGAQAR